MKTFLLPDLGEGLPEAEIVSWHVASGDHVSADAPLVSVETAKAVVEVPSPFSGTVVKLHASAGDFVKTGGPLVDFELEGGSDSGHDQPGGTSADAGTVVGMMPVGDTVMVEQAVAGTGRRRAGRTRAIPAVRVLAKRLGVDIETVAGSGAHGQVTSRDVEAAAQSATAAGSNADDADWETLRGLRRAMAQSMTRANAEICHASIFDDADINGWEDGQDVTLRLLRAICKGAAAEPALNVQFDAASMRRRQLPQLDIGIAVDTPNGLIVPVMRDVRAATSGNRRKELQQLKKAAAERQLAPADLRGSAITLSNFGMLAGRYARVVVVPPGVAILGAGAIRRDAVATGTELAVRRRLPLSLSFDHRCVTGAESCRFLAAAIADLQRQN